MGSLASKVQPDLLVHQVLLDSRDFKGKRASLDLLEL
jgi:hypothetical protein